MQKVMDVAKKIIGNGVGVTKETSKEMNSHIYAGGNLAFQPERRKIPFPVNPHRKQDMIKKAEHSVSASAENESIIKQIKAEQEPVSIEKEQPAEKPPQPKEYNFDSVNPKV